MLKKIRLTCRNLLVALIVGLTLYCLVYLLGYALVHHKESTSHPHIVIPHPSKFSPTRSSLHNMFTHGYTQRFTSLHKVAQKKASLCISTKGGMGNVMFQYASMFGIAKSKNMTPMYHDSTRLLQSAFSTTTALPTRQCSGNKLHKSKQDSAYNEVDVEFPNDKDATLREHGYYQSWRYFGNYFAEIRREFRFKDPIMNAANDAIRKAVSTLPHSSGRKRTYVMIHARRGDYADKTKHINVGYITPSPAYYHKAMEWYRKRYTPVVFVICSDSIDWTKKHLNKSADVVFIEGKTMAVDLAVLSLGNHTIMSVGTFGWWGSFLAGGDTVAYSHPGKNGSYIRKQFSADLRDFYLPHWVLMDDT